MSGYEKSRHSFFLAIEGLANHGFDFIEFGSVTPNPQPGNPKPQVFRLKEDQAVINCYGCISAGHEDAHINISNSKKTNAILGINLAKNKTSQDAVDDYVQGVKNLGMPIEN